MDSFSCTGYAIYQGLRKLSLFYGSEISYTLISVKSSEYIPIPKPPEKLCILCFLCDAVEIRTFFVSNFRSIYPILCLVNSDHFTSEQSVLSFARMYRLPSHTVFAVSPNLAFQAAITQKQDNYFFNFYHAGKLHNQNYDFFQQLKKIHFLAVSKTKGDD